ncbi:hypothetical protein DMUE_0985 [Dictyocoela muelleri]|nr:hypothetical protein DMUE_0985 [Dictyocoela muelleri]
MRDAISFSKYAWDEVTRDSISNCFKKALCTEPIEEINAVEYLDNQLIENFEEITKHIPTEDVVEQNDYVLYDPNSEVSILSKNHDENNAFKNISSLLIYIYIYDNHNPNEIFLAINDEELTEKGFLL